MSEQPHSRRQFFREVVKRYVEPAADYLDSKRQTESTVVLRPPGAIVEEAFLSTCERCQACVSSCPAGAIRSIEVEGPLQGTPGIVAADQACVVCADLDCMSACPSGALQVVLRDEIDLGRAVVEASICVRSKGEGCSSCIDLCPRGGCAIRIGESDQVEILGGCVGCGVCEQVCPTTPKAVRVDPRVRLEV